MELAVLMSEKEISKLAGALAKAATSLAIVATPELQAAMNTAVVDAYNELQCAFESQASVIKNTLSIAQACSRRLPLDDYPDSELVAARNSLRHMACVESRAGNNAEFWRLEFANRYLDAQIRARGIRL